MEQALLRRGYREKWPVLDDVAARDQVRHGATKGCRNEACQ